MQRALRDRLSLSDRHHHTYLYVSVYGVEQHSSFSTVKTMCVDIKSNRHFNYMILNLGVKLDPDD